MTRQLEKTPHVAGKEFTAADISVAYAMLLARRCNLLLYDDVEAAYIARVTGRDGYKQAMDTCRETKAWAAARGI